MPSWVPLGLSFMAAVLRKEGHTVAIFDRCAWQAKANNDTDQVNQAMLRQIETFQPDLIGLNTVSPLIYDTVECVDLIRRSYRGLLIAGGHHATALPELTLQKIPGLNGAVAGEGEHVIARLAKGNDPVTIPGLWWRKNGGIVCGPPPEQIKDLDRLPLPALDLLDMSFYTRPGLRGVRGYYLSTGSMLASRGCVRKCEFCTESLTYGRGVRYHSPEYVAEWAGKMIADYGVEGIYFHDNNFLLDRDWVERVCAEFLKKGINKKVKWSIQARADCIEEDLLKTLQRAGCVQVEIGVESSFQQHLDSVDKRTTVEMNEQALALCRKVGLNVHVYMIIAFEDEGLRDLEQKLNWLKKNRPATFDWSVLGIYPGTALYLKKGNDFFARQEWTEARILPYYQQGLSGVMDWEERRQWLRRHFFPYQKWQHRRHVLRVNGIDKIIRLLWTKAKRELKRPVL